MDFNRIDEDLRISIENTPYSLEIDEDVFLNNPELIQKERKEFIKAHPFKHSDYILIKDIFIESSVDRYEIRLHIYQPEKYNMDKTLLYFHGGGYVFGLPEQVDNQMFEIADKLNATIVSVDYRLSPQYRFPVPILDGFDALQWVISEGEAQLGINPAHITVLGASAGGHLAAAVTQMAVDHHIENIKHQFLLYPVIHNRLDTSSMEEFTDALLWNRIYAQTAWLHFLGEENVNKRIRYADLTHYDNFTKLPPTTIVACELDPLRDEDIEFAQLLYKAGVKTELWVIPGALHVFDLFDSPMNNQYKKFMMGRLFCKTNKRKK
ncbi:MULTISPECIES: alpha/beta hydrolase [unclassified Chryseobacterium]|uniref:alpha/beta hydrolase n=1 Tax=unclassified Chryseobacterium TaxID=2593645 RepID=UPI001D3CE535|nr:MULTISPECIES: alpha/beta hydrolase [unclassified Chryseobacterium]MCQ9635834.1 alpha/beta hydrolase [Chryseobacterium sp. WG23]CAH0216421.1 Carboxylesterase NlhH [Chryseobacterium sp. Bi04]